MEPLLPAFRRELRARAHHLDPVVSIGHHGLTPAVLHEIDVALTAHELIKVRVLGDDRGERDALLVRICAETDCGAVQRIGKLLVLWRPRPAEAAGESARPAGRKGIPRARPALAKGVATLGPTSFPAPPRAMRRRRPGLAHAHAYAATGRADRRPFDRVKSLAQPPAASGRRRGARSGEAAPPKAPAPRSAQRRGGAHAAAAPTRVAAGKAPTGVPRAATPRRRRSAS